MVRGITVGMDASTTVPESDAALPVVIRLECTEDGASKFWEGAVEGATFTARWGRIGASGQTKSKDLPTAAKAAAELAKLVAEKLGKGYVDVSAPVVVGEGGAAVAGQPAAQASAVVAVAAPAAKPQAEGRGEAAVAAAALVVEAVAADAEGWVTTVDGYGLRLVDGALQCRNAKGKLLASVPPTVKKSEAAEGLVALTDFLAAHAEECRATVDGWMLGSLPVPRALLTEVWADSAWRVPLDNAVVAPIVDGVVRLDDAGLLRDVDPQRGLGLVDLDGESVWTCAAEVLIPHPILLPELDDWRQLGAELGVSQAIAQLFRETFARPAGLAAEASSLSTWAGGWFEQLAFALGRSKTLGYRVRGGFACCKVREPGRDLRAVEARFWIGSEAPESETETGELVWVDGEERTLALADLGPVAISEGIRMASAIFAGRMTRKEDDA